MDEQQTSVEPAVGQGAALIARSSATLRSAGIAGDAGLMRVESELHDALQAWAEDHARRYSTMGVLDYDPIRFPAQRIVTSVSPRASAEHSDPGWLRSTYLGSGGPVARETLAAFEEVRSASGRGRRSVAEQIAELVERGSSVAILCAHADGLDDVAGFAGALAVAMQGSAAETRNGLVLNKVMSRETFAGVPIVTLLRSFANIFWVIPDSDSAHRWGISLSALRYVNGLAIRSLLAAIREGAAITFAPAGSAMIPRRDRQGTLIALRFPPVGAATMKLLARFDFYVVAARFGAGVHVSEPRPVSAGPAGSARDGLTEALHQLAEATALVAAVRVEAARRGSGRVT